MSPTLAGMIDEVWSLPESDRIRMGTFNGFGLQLKGFTRVDASGRCFATRGLVFCYVPIFPMNRFYLREGSTRDYHAGLYSNTTTGYSIDGESRLRAGEVLHADLFWWLVAPGVALLLPALLLLNEYRIPTSCGTSTTSGASTEWAR